MYVNPYKKIFTALNKNRIKYLAIGGVAVNLYGYSRLTNDIDILLALDGNNLQRMQKVMKQLGYVQRLPIELYDLSDKKKVKNWIKEKGMTAYTFISDNKPQLDLDIVVSHSLNFEKYYKKRKTIEVWGMRLAVVSINDLIAMKKEAGRDKDLLDLKILLELKSL